SPEQHCDQQPKTHRASGQRGTAAAASAAVATATAAASGAAASHQHSKLFPSLPDQIVDFANLRSFLPRRALAVAAARVLRRIVSSVVATLASTPTPGSARVASHQIFPFIDRCPAVGC